MFSWIYNRFINAVNYPECLRCLDEYPELLNQLICAKACKDPSETLIFALDQSNLAGIAVEFGVYTGGSLKSIARYFPHKAYGFDSFAGLPEDWREGFPKGHFSLSNEPIIDKAKLVVGLFEDTLEQFLREKKPRISFIHMDADLYSSTSFVLDKLNPFIDAGCIIVFDELINYPEFEKHELKALIEFSLKFQRKLKPIAFTSWHEQVAFKVLI